MANTESLNDLPAVVLLEVLSYLGPEDLVFNISKLGDRWDALARNKMLWKKLNYKCDCYSDLDRISEVRCTTFLGFSTN